MTFTITFIEYCPVGALCSVRYQIHYLRNELIEFYLLFQNMDIPPSTKTAAATKTKPISLTSYLSSSSKLQTPKKYDTSNSKFSVTTKIYPQNFTDNI